MNSKQAPFMLPYLLDFAGPNKFKPGRGSAGHTVAEFKTREDRLEFMRAYPESRMPCWVRIEKGEV